jgi:hypothetical protein
LIYYVRRTPYKFLPWFFPNLGSCARCVFDVPSLKSISSFAKAAYPRSSHISSYYSLGRCILFRKAYSFLFPLLSPPLLCHPPRSLSPLSPLYQTAETRHRTSQNHALYLLITNWRRTHVHAAGNCYPRFALNTCDRTYRRLNSFQAGSTLSMTRIRWWI